MHDTGAIGQSAMHATRRTAGAAHVGAGAEVAGATTEIPGKVSGA